MTSDYALSALDLLEFPNPGRCPGLLHFAPLALRFKGDSISHDFESTFCAKLITSVAASAMLCGDRGV